MSSFRMASFRLLAVKERNKRHAKRCINATRKDDITKRRNNEKHERICKLSEVLRITVMILNTKTVFFPVNCAGPDQTAICKEAV